MNPGATEAAAESVSVVEEALVDVVGIVAIAETMEVDDDGSDAKLSPSEVSEAPSSGSAPAALLG